MLRRHLLERKIRKQICSAGKALYEKGLVSANDGNISCRTAENEVLFTPANFSKGSLRPSMLVKTDMQGKQIEGRLKVTSEYRLHLGIYAANKHIRAIVHAHPIEALSFAVAGIPLDKAYMVEASVILGVVPVAPFSAPGSPEVAKSAAAFCNEYNAVLLQNHGLVTWGRDLKEAHFRMEIAEDYAKITKMMKRDFDDSGLLTEAQVDTLMEIRKRLGIKAGGRPVGRER